MAADYSVNDTVHGPFAAVDTCPDCGTKAVAEGTVHSLPTDPEPVGLFRCRVDGCSVTWTRVCASSTVTPISDRKITRA